MNRKIPLLLLLLLLSRLDSYAQNCFGQYTLYQENTSFTFYQGVSYDKNICKGGKMKLGVSYVNDEFTDLKLQWYKNDSPIAGATKSTFEISEFGSYYLIIRKGNCQYRIPQAFRVRESVINYPPIIYPEGRSFNLDTATICDKGGSVSLARQSSVSSDENWQWMLNGKDIPDANNFRFVAKEEGIYRARFKQGECSGVSNTVVVRKSNAIKERIRIYNDTKITKDTLDACKGLPLILTSANNNSVWLKDGKQFGVSNSIQATETGTYSFTYKDGECLIQSNQLYLRFDKGLPPPFIERPGFLNSNCTIGFRAIVDWGYRDPLKDLVISYYRDGNEISRKNFFSNDGTEGLIFNQMQAGVYQAKIELGSCRSESNIVEVRNTNTNIARVKLAVDGKNKHKICHGTPFILNNGSGSGLWYKDGKLLEGVSGSIYMVTESGKYHSVANLISGCRVISDTVEVQIIAPISKSVSVTCIGAKTILSTTSSGNYIYQWYANNKPITGATSATYEAKYAGDYHVSINDKDFCSVESDKVKIGEVITTNNRACIGDTLVLSSSKAGQWSGPQGVLANGNSFIAKIDENFKEGLYEFKMTDERGCIVVDTFKINRFYKTTIVEDVMIPNTIVEGGKFVYSIKRQAAALFTDNLGNTEFIYSYKIFDPIKVTDSGKYYVKAMNNYGCITTKVVNLNVIKAENAPIKIKPVNIEKVCVGEKIDIHFETQNLAPDDTLKVIMYFPYLIYTTNSLEVGKGTKSPISVSVPPEYQSGHPEVGFRILSSKSKILSGVSNLIPITQIKELRITPENYNACEGSKINLKITTNAIHSSYEWYLGSNLIATTSTPNFEAEKSGTYSVKARKPDGCFDRSIYTTEIKFGKLENPTISLTNLSINRTFCEGQAVKINARSTYQNTKDVTYHWLKNGIEIKDNDTIKNDILVNSTGFYAFRIKQKTCESTSEAIQLSFNKQLELKLIPSFVGQTTDERGYYSELSQNHFKVCRGSTVNISTNLTESFKNEKYEVVWLRNDKDTLQSKTLSLSTNLDGTYRARIKIGECIAYSDLLRITHTDSIKLPITIPLDLALCGQDSFYKVYNSDGDSYNINLSKFGVIGWQYITISGDKKDLSPTNWLYITEPGVYIGSSTFMIDNKACFVYTDTVRAKETKEIKDLQWLDDFSTCEPSVQLDKNYILDFKGIEKVNWLLNGQRLEEQSLRLNAKQSGVYQLSYVTDEGCTHSYKPFRIDFGNLNLKTSSQIVSCLGQPSTLRGLVQSRFNPIKDFEINADYQWFKDGVKIEGAVGPELKTYEKGSYIVEAKYGACSTKSAPIQVDKTTSLESANLLSVKDSIFACPNTFVKITSNLDGVSAKLQWLKNGSIINGQNGFELSTKEVGRYSLKITDSECITESNPVVFSHKIIPPTAVISGGKDINFGDSTQIKVDFTSSAPWTFKMTNNQEFTTERNPFQFGVKPQQTTVYELASVKNNCGEGTVSGKAEVKIIILGNEEIAGAKVSLYPIPAQSNCRLSVETVFPERLQWQLYTADGKLISKTESQKLSNNYQESLSLQELSNGTYLLKIIIGNKILTRKIIKQD